MSEPEQTRDDRPASDAEREQLAFGRRIDWVEEATFGTVFFGPEKHRQFPALSVGHVESLLENEYLDPRYRHNEAPPAEELVEWARSVQTRYKPYQFEVGLIGYMVGPDREDSRTALEGVIVRSAGPIPEDLKQEVAKRFSPDLLAVDDFVIELVWE